jgi:hypothetical protein
MLRILLGGATFVVVAALVAPDADAMGGGPTPYWASPWYSPNGHPRVVRDPNECPPQIAKPVWAAGGALAGYSCNTPSAN